MPLGKAILRSLAEAVFIGAGVVLLARVFGGFFAYKGGVNDLEVLGGLLLVYVLGMVIYRTDGGSR